MPLAQVNIERQQKSRRMAPSKKNKVKGTIATIKERDYFSVDLKRMLKKLEEKFQALALRIEGAADQANLETELGLAELEKHWTSVLNTISKKRATLNLKIQDRIDKGKIQGRRTKKGAENSFRLAKSSLGRMHAEMQHLQSRVGTDAREIFERLRRSYKQLFEGSDN